MINYSTIYFIQFCSPISHQFKPKYSFDSIGKGISNDCLNKEGVKIKCHKYFNMKYGRHLRQIICTPSTILLIVIFTLRNSKLNGKILLHVLLFCQVRRRCTVCLRADGDHTLYWNIYDIRFWPLPYFETDYWLRFGPNQMIFRARTGGWLGYRTVKMKQLNILIQLRKMEKIYCMRFFFLSGIQ